MKTIVLITLLLLTACATVQYDELTPWQFGRLSFAIGVVDSLSSVNHVLSLGGYSPIECQAFSSSALQFNIIQTEPSEIETAKEKLLIIQKEMKNKRIDGDL